MCLRVKGKLLHLNEIDHATKRFRKMGRSCSDRQRDDDCFRVEAFLDIIDDCIEISAFTVHLVDERNSWHVIFVSLSPDRFALCFNSFARAENDDPAVKNAERAFDFSCKIDVTRRVDEVDSMIIPFEGHASGVDRYAAFSFFRIIVGNSRACVNHSNLVDEFGIEEHFFRHRRFSSVNVGDDADITKVLFRARSL